MDKKRDPDEQMDPLRLCLSIREPSQPFPVDSVHRSLMDATESNKGMHKKRDPVEDMDPLRFRLSIMEPSQPSPVDSVYLSPMDATENSVHLSPMDATENSVHLSPMDAIESMREMHKKREFFELMQPSKRIKSSKYMPSSPVDSVRPPLMDAIESIKKMYEKIDPVEQIDSLISFLENQLRKMNTPSEAGSSLSEGCLNTVGDVKELAAKTVVTISMEAEKLFKLDAVKAMESLTLKVMKGVGELLWIFIGLSLAAFTVESYTRVESTAHECREFLPKIIEVAKKVKQYREHNRVERKQLCKAVGTIVGGICCEYLRSGKNFRFWSDMRAVANQQMRYVRDSLGLSGGLQILKQSAVSDFQPNTDKDVFLSHSGKQKNFVRRLYQDLKSQHVSCFFDEEQESLPLAARFPPLILNAADKCKIAVLVLSREFILSKWPMVELSAFVSAMTSGKNTNLKLLPIFYKITVGELSHFTADEDWQKLKEINDTRGNWQDALNLVRSINGSLFVKRQNELVFRGKLVKDICCLLNGINRPKLLDFKPVGIENQVKDVKELLDMEGAQSALAVVLCGFGGVGKSTLAAYAVETLDWSSTEFKFCRVEIDEKTRDRTSHIIKLQKDIIYDLGGGKVDLRDPLDGRLKIKVALKNKCSLLFIDNVDKKAYIKELLPKDLLDETNIKDPLPQDLSSGEQKTKLRIIITSRQKHVRAAFSIICKEYHVEGLSDSDSKRLLSETILERQVAKANDFDEEHFINEVAAACKGVPLLLSVFGEHLRVERNKDSYNEALNVLREGDLDDYREECLGRKLMFVYNKIEKVEVKEAFLDICTYFHGWKWNLVADIVDIHTLEDLHRRMLVSKRGSDEVIVHDILRLMGMKDARPTRFSNYEELSDALEDNLRNVKGISLVSDNHLRTIQSSQLEAMHQSLRVLMLGDWVTLDGPPCHKAFRNLRYLRLGDIAHFPFKDPSKLDKLRVFLNRSKPGMNLSHLPSGLKRISHEVPPDVECDKFEKLPFQNLRSLKSFIVKTWIPVKLDEKFVQTGTSVELPEELYLPASLVDLELSGCKNLPEDVGRLTALESLILDKSDLKCLPQGFGRLKKLKHLSMNHCSKLASLSEELGMLSSLEVLSMTGCGNLNLRALPKGLERLLSLLSKSTNLQLFYKHTLDLPSKILKPKNSIQKFIESFWDGRYGQSQSVAGQSKTREFVEALKGNGIHHLLIGSNTNKVVVDDLDGKAIGFIISDFKFLEYIKLQQIYKDIHQKDSDFIAIWIPAYWPENCGHGTYTRLIQCMPWATFPLPQLVNDETSSPRGCPRFVLLDKDGQIANYDAMPLLLGWGVKSYPFTKNTLPESFSLMESESCLEILLHGMNIVGRKPMDSKMTFLYAERPSEWHKMKSKLEELTHIHGSFDSFEVVYVGKFCEEDFYDIEKLKQDYEDATQNLSWPSLSLSDMIRFWYRCECLDNASLTEEALNLNKETLLRLGSNLRLPNIWLVLLDNDGVVTYAGYDVLQMICESSAEISNGEEMAMVKDELMNSLSRGECSPIVQTFFRDEIISDLPGHPHLHTWSSPPYDSPLAGTWYKCHDCSRRKSFGSYQQRSYVGGQWRLCGRCWMAYAQRQVQRLLLAKDN